MNLRSVIATFALSATLVSTSRAHADIVEPPSFTTPQTAEPAVDWYAGRIVLADLGAIAGFGLGGIMLLGAGLGGGDPTPGAVVVVASVASYAVVPFTMHLARGNALGATRSAIARVGLPLLGTALGYAVSPDGDAPIGLAVGGIGVAMMLDWAVFARMPVERTVPFVTPSPQGGVQVGLAAQF